MQTVASTRKFQLTLFQRKMNQPEIETEISRLERKFKKMDRMGNIQEWFQIQDELGVMYKRLMNMERRKKPQFLETIKSDLL